MRTFPCLDCGGASPITAHTAPPGAHLSGALPAALPLPNAIKLALLGVKNEVNPTIAVVPGGYDMAMIVAADQLGFRLSVACSEAGAAWIAAALAWETRRHTIAFAITSPGVYGTIQALHYACVSGVP